MDNQEVENQIGGAEAPAVEQTPEAPEAPVEETVAGETTEGGASETPPV